jgi:hypothetical protein
MRICLTTAFNAAYAEMGAVCEASLAAYARAQDLELRVVRGVVPDRPPAWTKIKVIASLFQEGFDFVLWVDTDAVIVRTDADIRGEIEDGKDLYLVAHQVDVHPMPGMMVRLDVPNTGVMLLRNSDWMRRFLEETWSRTAYLHHRWWENAAVIELLGYHRLLDQVTPNAPDPAVMAHVKWLDWNWNSLPDGCQGQRPIIRHHTRAASPAERIAGMRRDLAAPGGLEEEQQR